MNEFNNALKMVTPHHLDRRTCLKGITLGAGAVVLQPFLNALAAEARGEAPPPRIVFLSESNGLWPYHLRPKSLDTKKGDQWPMILVGNLGGKVKTAGRYLQFPKYNTPGHRTLSNFYLSLLHAVGDKREKFGDADLAIKDIDTSGPLAEILA